jgi:hypothetical protein
MVGEAAITERATVANEPEATVPLMWRGDTDWLYYYTWWQVSMYPLPEVRHRDSREGEMIYQADFSEDGQVRWQEADQPTPRENVSQMAMFTDRRDLWPSKPRGKRPGSQKIAGQPSLFKYSEERRQTKRKGQQSV